MPVAPRRKRLLHALYLAQPLLQFAALMAVLFVLGRCSPMSSSQDKSVNKATSSGLATPHSRPSDQNAEEQDIQKLLSDVANSEDLPLLSQSDFAKRVLPNSLLAEKGSDLPGIQALFARKAAQKDVRLLVARLLEDQRKAFFANGSVRLTLADTFGSNMAPDVRRAYFTELDKALRAHAIMGRAFLVMADDAKSDGAFGPEQVTSIPVPVKLQLAVSTDNTKAWLQATRGNVDESQQKLIESAKDKAVALALVLE
jgi:hypothetical protein